MKQLLLRAALALTLGLALPAGALEVVQTARMKLVAGPSAGGLVEQLARTIEADRDRVVLDLGRDWDGITEVRVAADDLEFRALLPENRNVPRWAVGVAFPSENLVVLQSSPNQPIRETLRHELSHVGIGRLTRTPVPRWFLEGLASVREEAPWSREGVSLVWAARTGQLFSFSALDRSFPAGRIDAELAYAQSADFVQYLIENSEPGAVSEIVQAVVAGHSFEVALADATGQSMGALETHWRDSLLRWDMFLRVLTSQGMLWGLLSLLVVFVYFEVRRRKQMRLRLLELEELMESTEAFPDADGFEPGAAEGLALPVWDDDLEEKPAVDDASPKKPTLH